MTETSLEYARLEKAEPWASAILAENEMLRRELVVALRGSAAVGAVHQCPNWGEMERLLRFTKIDVLVLPSAEGHRLRAFARHGVRPKVLMLIDEAHVADPSPLADAPVDGFLLRQRLSAQSMHDVLHRMRNGEIPMPTALARQLLGGAGTHPAHLRPLSLTARENETLGLLAAGLSNKQIARRLKISEHGVKRLVSSLLLKLGSPNRTTAVVTAIKHGIINSL
jgi:two-component system nitrate/nitrite response regulator NarL